MGPRRKGPRPRRPKGDAPPALLWSFAAGLIVAACLCAFDFDLNGNSHHPRRAVCTNTCEARLHTAALESHVPPSASSPAANPLFPRQGSAPTSPFGVGSDGTGQLSQARPRRLPPLIKILTGFGDEPSSSGEDKSAVVRIERPKFVKRRREDNRPSSHEDTVQAAAVAAATAVFSKSTHVNCTNRMQKVNSEWEAALRWIAGWDQQRQQQMPSPFDSRRSLGTPVQSNGSGRASNDSSREGFDNFVDDLARMLEECITQCTEDANFEAWQAEDEHGEGDFSIGGPSMSLRSVFWWAAGASSSFGELGSISPESKAIVANAFRLVSSSLAAYALLSLGTWAYPTLRGWYTSLGYSESPEWLLQHEKELKDAKSSRSRQKKKKRKASGRRSAVVNAGAEKERSPAKQSSVGDPPPAGPAQQDETVDRKQLSMPTVEKPAVPESKDSVTGSNDSSIPSVISYTTTSATSSPSTIKPIGSHLEEGSPYLGGRQGPPEPIPRLMFPQPANPKPLSVPTQEQRNEAARQLREFQQAQIQRILLQRKLTQSSSSIASAPQSSTAPAPAPATQGPRLIPPQNSVLSQGSAFHSPETKVLRPPPGLSHPTEAQPNLAPLVQYDTAFLADNELLLSKLLDDDDDDDAQVPAPVDLGIESMSAEPSLDPSAAPFVSSAIVESAQVAAKEEKGDAWQSPAPRVSSPVGIKGVYGGSVW